MVGMKSTDRIRTFAWACLLFGGLIIAWQAASGGGSDKLFNIGLVAMITGSVLRVYGKYRRRNRWADVPPKPAAAPWVRGRPTYSSMLGIAAERVFDLICDSLLPEMSPLMLRGCLSTVVGGAGVALVSNGRWRFRATLSGLDNGR